MSIDTTTIVYLSAEVIVGFITIVGNCLVLGAIIKSHQLHTVTNVFVGNLAVADIAVGVLVAPCAALSFLGLPHNFHACVFINCLILMFTNVSILMLLFVAIERFIAIKEPFVYQRLLTIKRAFYVNFCVWVLGSILGLVPMYGWHREYQEVSFCSFTGTISYEYMVYFQFFGLVLLPLFVMLCIYIYILLIVRRHMRQTNALQNQFRQNKDAKDGFSRDVRAAKMFALVILLFGIFWIPVNLFNCVSLFCGVDCPFPLQSLLVAIVMSHANSSINPFLYATSNSRIKRGLKELLRMKVSPSDRSVTDYENKRPITNGKSYARDNSVAPISSVGDYSVDEGGQTYSGSQKTLLAKNTISVVLPIDQHLQNGKGSQLNSVSDAISDTDIRATVNAPSQLQDNQCHTSSHSWLSALAMSETLAQNSRPNSQISNHENSHEAASRTNIIQATSKRSETPPTTPPSPSDRHNDDEHNCLQQEGHSNIVSVVSQVTEPRNEDSVNKSICDNNVNSTHKTFSRHRNDSADSKTSDSKTSDSRTSDSRTSQRRISDSRTSDSIRGQHDSTPCWTTSVTQDALDGSVHDLPHPLAVNGKRQPVSVNVLQTTNVNCDMSEELVVNRLNGHVIPERTLSSLNSHKNSLTENPGFSELAKNKFEIPLDNLQKGISLKSDEFGTERNSEI